MHLTGPLELYSRSVGRDEHGLRINSDSPPAVMRWAKRNRQEVNNGQQPEGEFFTENGKSAKFSTSLHHTEDLCESAIRRTLLYQDTFHHQHSLGLCEYTQ